MQPTTPRLTALAALGREPLDQAVEAYAATAPGSPQAAAGLKRLREAAEEVGRGGRLPDAAGLDEGEDRQIARLQHLLELYPDHTDVADWRAALDSLEAHDGGDDA